MPRNRLGEFYCTLLPRYQRHDNYTDKTIIDLFNDGSKEILGYEIAPNESAEVWKSLLNSFKQRGLERTSLICSDGLNDMENAINKTFPQTNIQRRLVYVSRNISAKVLVKDRREILQDFKEVSREKTKELALEKPKVLAI